MKRQFFLRNAMVKAHMMDELQQLPCDERKPLVVEVKEMTRNLDQNAAQWPILQAFSDQLQWPVNGKMVCMTPDEWKDVLTAAFKREQIRMAMGLDGGLVMLGQRTSKFTVKQFSEWMEFLIATAVERGVNINGRMAVQYADAEYDGTS